MKNIDVTIENFGKIQHAQFQVKPFTVIAGKNASGKSFITRALYSIFNTLNKDHLSIELEETLSRLGWYFEKRSITGDLTEEDKRRFLDSRSVLADLEKRVSFVLEQVTLAEKFTQICALNEEIEQLSVNVLLLQNVELLSWKAAVLGYIRSLEILSENPKNVFQNVLGWNIERSLISNFQVNSARKLKSQNAMDSDDTSIQFGDGICHLKITQVDLQLKLKTQEIDIFQQIDNVVYLESPIYWKIKDVLKEWIDLRNDPSLRKDRKHKQKELKKAPQYILDTFALLDADVIQDEVFEELVELKNKIDKCIGGQIQISQSGDLQFISQNQSGESFGVDLNQTASGTTSLGLISLLLEKNVIVPNSVLIMDEPEVNLHPQWQQVMIQVLYQLSISGVKIIMASHSFDMMSTIERMMELHEEKGLDVGDHFSLVQLDEGNTINHDKPSYKKLDAIKGDLGMPLFNLFANS